MEMILRLLFFFFFFVLSLTFYLKWGRNSVFLAMVKGGVATLFSYIDAVNRCRRNTDDVNAADLLVSFTIVKKKISDFMMVNCYLVLLSQEGISLIFGSFSLENIEID